MNIMIMMDFSSLPTAESTAILPSITSDHDLRVSCYCEENAWRLVYRHLHYQKQQTTNSSNNCNYFVVFVSNDKRCCPYFNQRAKPKPTSTDDISTMDYVCWDYHVIVIRHRAAAIPSDDTSTREAASNSSNNTSTMPARMHLTNIALCRTQKERGLLRPRYSNTLFLVCADGD